MPVCSADAIPSTNQCEAHVSATAPTGSVTTYYLNLTLDSTGNQIFNNHIPVDPYVEEKIYITKTSSLVNVTRGQLVPYTITVKNTLRSTLPALGIVDTLPIGFKYVEGSARVDELPREPVNSGGQLRWNNLDVGYNQVHTIKLLLVVGAGVTEGKYVNQAQVINIDTNNPFSEVAIATVRVIPDPDFDCTDIIGKVFDDANANVYPDSGEKGLPGVRLVTARGLIATTDEFGRFHITCAAVPDEDRGSNFILKLDDRTLPSGYRVTSEEPAGAARHPRQDAALQLRRDHPPRGVPGHLRRRVRTEEHEAAAAVAAEDRSPAEGIAENAVGAAVVVPGGGGEQRAGRGPHQGAEKGNQREMGRRLPAHHRDRGLLAPRVSAVTNVSPTLTLPLWVRELQ